MEDKSANVGVWNYKFSQHIMQPSEDSPDFELPIGTKVRLNRPYQGAMGNYYEEDDGTPIPYTQGIIVEHAFRNFAGVPVYGLNLFTEDGRSYLHPSGPAVVDFSHNEITPLDPNLQYRKFERSILSILESAIDSEPTLYYLIDAAMNLSTDPDLSKERLDEIINSGAEPLGEEEQSGIRRQNSLHQFSVLLQKFVETYGVAVFKDIVRDVSQNVSVPAVVHFNVFGFTVEIIVGLDETQVMINIKQAKSVDFTYKFAEYDLNGEWFIDDSGFSTFADSDIGDMGHERLAVESMIGDERLMDRFAEAFYEGGEPLTDEERAEMDANETGFLSFLEHHGDPREWVIEKHNWIRVGDNNFQLWTLDADAVDRIIGFLSEELDGGDNPDLYINELSTGQIHDFTAQELFMAADDPKKMGELMMKINPSQVPSERARDAPHYFGPEFWTLPGKLTVPPPLPVPDPDTINRFVEDYRQKYPRQENNFAQRKLDLVKTAYGGPAFDISSYLDEYQRREYLTTKQLYEDVDLELSNQGLSNIIWFQDSVDPVQYTGGMTVENCWQDDYKDGIDNFQVLLDWIEQTDGSTFTPEELAGYDRSQMNCIYKLLMDWDFETIQDNWDKWGPFTWHSDAFSEWSRCQSIARDNEEYPIAVLATGQMLDGAHRLAVALLNRRRDYPALVGVPIRDMENLKNTMAASNWEYHFPAKNMKIAKNMPIYESPQTIIAGLNYFLPQYNWRLGNVGQSTTMSGSVWLFNIRSQHPTEDYTIQIEMMTDNLEAAIDSARGSKDLIYYITIKDRGEYASERTYVNSPKEVVEFVKSYFDSDNDDDIQSYDPSPVDSGVLEPSFAEGWQYCFNKTAQFEEEPEEPQKPKQIRDLFKHTGVWQYPFQLVKNDPSQGWYLDWFDQPGTIDDMSRVKPGDKVADDKLNMTPYWEVTFVDENSGRIYVQPLENNPFLTGVGAGGAIFTEHDFAVHSGEYEKERIDQLLDRINKRAYTDPRDIAYILLGTVPVHFGPNGAQGGWHSLNDRNRGAERGMSSQEIMMQDAASLKKLGFDIPETALNGTLPTGLFSYIIEGGFPSDRQEMELLKVNGEDFDNIDAMKNMILTHPQPSIKLRNMRLLFSQYYKDQNNPRLIATIRDIAIKASQMFHPRQKIISNENDGDRFDPYFYIKENIILIAGRLGWSDVLKLYEKTIDHDNRNDVARNYAELGMIDDLLRMEKEDNDPKVLAGILYSLFKMNISGKFADTTDIIDQDMEKYKTFARRKKDNSAYQYYVDELLRTPVRKSGLKTTLKEYVEGTAWSFMPK